jgi:hypothetical protein
MDEAKHLLAFGKSIAQHVVDLHPGTVFAHGIKDARTYELHPSVGGVEYEITISVMTLARKGKAAETELDELMQIPSWRENALKGGTDEAKKREQLEQMIAWGRAAIRR